MLDWGRNKGAQWFRTDPGTRAHWPGCRALQEAIEENVLCGQYDAERVIGANMGHYNHKRFHSAWGFQTPATWYRGNRADVIWARRLRLSRPDITANRSTSASARGFAFPNQPGAPLEAEPESPTCRWNKSKAVHTSTPLYAAFLP
jgi:hypothetical protein